MKINWKKIEMKTSLENTKVIIEPTNSYMIEMNPIEIQKCIYKVRERE